MPLRKPELRSETEYTGILNRAVKDGRLDTVKHAIKRCWCGRNEEYRALQAVDE